MLGYKDDLEAVPRAAVRLRGGGVVATVKGVTRSRPTSAKDMKRRSGPLRVALLVCLCGVFAADGLCAEDTTRVPCGFCEEQDRFVRLERSVAVRHEEPFEHPVAIAAEQWSAILNNIRIQSRTERFPFVASKGPITSAFTDEEIEYLGTTLSKTFAEARPNETVVFGLISHRTPDLLEMTTGAWFVKHGSLHLLLANHRETVALPNIRELLWKEPLRPHNSDLYEFISGCHMSRVQREDRPKLPFGSPLPELAIAYQALLQKNVDRPSDSTQSGGAPSPPVSSSRPTTGEPSIEERLRRLGGLKNAGVITEEEYDGKKIQLLDGLQSTCVVLPCQDDTE